MALFSNCHLLASYLAQWLVAHIQLEPLEPKSISAVEILAPLLRNKESPSLCVGSVHVSFLFQSILLFFFQSQLSRKDVLSKGYCTYTYITSVSVARVFSCAPKLKVSSKTDSDCTNFSLKLIP